MKQVFVIQINYKSGHRVYFAASEFELKGGTINYTTLSEKDFRALRRIYPVPNDIQRRMMLGNMDEFESIYYNVYNIEDED